MSRTIPTVVVGTFLAVVLATSAAAAPPAAGPTVPVGAAGATVEAGTGAEAALANVASVAAGYYNGCAVLTNGQARCWGWNGEGAVGNGSASDQFNTARVVRNPADTGPLTGVRQIAIGVYHACALLTSGQVRCWGDNEHGELGDGNAPADSLLPVVVRNAGDTGPLQDVIQISAEADGACALLASRQVRCWGEDEYGQLGNGLPFADSDLPVTVKGVTGGALTGVASLDGGYDTNCAALTNGQARCWGNNVAGGLGDGTTTDRNRPVVVDNPAGTGPLTGVTRISHGGHHGCARLTSAHAVCWGLNDDGALGDGTILTRLRPVYVKRNGVRVGGIRSIAAGNEHTCLLSKNGGAACWGDDSYAQNGDGTLQSPTFRKVANPVRNTANTGNLTGATQLDAHSYHACVRTASGQARCWGYGEYGGIGDGDTNDDVLPQVVLI